MSFYTLRPPNLEMLMNSIENHTEVEASGSGSFFLYGVGVFTVIFDDKLFLYIDTTTIAAKHKLSNLIFFDERYFNKLKTKQSLQTLQIYNYIYCALKQGKTKLTPYKTSWKNCLKIVDKKVLSKQELIMHLI